MNEKNFENVKKDVYFAGFGETLYDAIEANMRANKPEFNETASRDMDEGKVDAVLHFKQKNGNTYFNSYDATYKNGDIERSQRFYINSVGPSITLKEAGNMLAGSADAELGRAIYKELAKKPEEGQKITSADDIQTYRTWLQLDLTKQDENGQFIMNRYHDKYGFDHVKKLDELPLKELKNEKSRNIILSSVEKGAGPSATAFVDGKEIKINLFADPANREYVAIDSSGQKIDLKQSNKQTQSQSVDKDDKKKGLTNKNKQGNGLLEKKRQSNGQRQKIA